MAGLERKRHTHWRACCGATLSVSLLWVWGCATPEVVEADIEREHRRPIDPEPERCIGFDSLEDQVLYFVMTDRFYDGDPTNNDNTKPGDKGSYHGGDLRGLTDKLDYLSDLGVTAIWITPIIDQVDAPTTGAGFEDWGYHGYWGEDFEKLEPHLGRPADFGKLIREAHARQIRVVVDVVINHSGYRSKWADDASWARSKETGTCPSDADANDINRCLMGLPDFRTEDPKVREAVIGWQLGWAERFAFDGFRFDTLKHAEPEAFAELHRRAEKNAQDVHLCNNFLALGEWWGAHQGDEISKRLVDSGVADTLYDFAFHGDVEGFVSGRMRAEAMAHHLEKRHFEGALPMVLFLDSHDVDTMVYRLEGDRDRYAMAAALLMTVHGVPMLTWGNELAKAGGSWPQNRQAMPWEALETPEGKEMHDLWRALIRLRRDNPALRGTRFVTLAAASDEQGAHLAYLRGDLAEGAVLVAMARGNEAKLDMAIPGVEGAEIETERLLARGRVGTLDTEIQENVTRARLSLGGDAMGIWRIRRK